jgi:hypothetical protein
LLYSAVQSFRSLNSQQIGWKIAMGITKSFITTGFLLSAAIFVPLVLIGTVPAQTANSARQSPSDALPEHRAPHPPLPSSLPAPKLIGDPANRLQRTYSGTPVDVTTYHYNLDRTGWNPTETDLTPATVASSKFGLLATLSVDGNVLAQPLLLSAFVMPDGSTHDLLIVATGHNSVYAFDAQTYAALWQVNLGTAQKSSDVGCYDVKPEYGISSTPVIVRSSGNAATLYVVAATEPSPSQFVTTLHALNLATGADTVPATVIAPSATLSDGSAVTFDPQNQWNRAGLAYNNGSLYIGIGSHCDRNSGAITGWLLLYSGSTLALQNSFHTIETAGGTELSSIWMTGFAPAIDGKGNVFVVTGNGDFIPGKKDWGESVLKLGPTLAGVLTSFTPISYKSLNGSDGDFGSGGVMLLPAVKGQTAPPLAVAMGKASVLYLLNQNSLGGLKANDAGALQAQSGGGGGLWGGPAFYKGPSGPTVYSQTGGDVLRAWSVATALPPSLTNKVSGTSGAGYGGSLPIVSSNHAVANTGVVWLIDRANEPFSIEAYDAVKLRAPIFSAQIGTWSNAGNGNPFLTPMEANGRVYAPGYLMVQVYGLLP